MASSTTVSQRKQIKRKAPRSFLKSVFKRQTAHLRLQTGGDLLVAYRKSVTSKSNNLSPVTHVHEEEGAFHMHLNCLLFVHRLAEESRTNACEDKSGVIKKEHVLAAAKVILKKSKG